MTKPTGLVIAVLLLGAALLYWLLPDKDEPPRAASSGNAAGAARELRLPLAEMPQGFATGLENLPGSLAGTEVDGELEFDDRGHLKITNGVRRVFDYFLSTIGEESLETIVARIRAYIRHKLPPTAAAEAERLLDGYIAYKHGLDSLQQAQVMAGDRVDIDAVRRQMQQVQALRSQFFSAEVVAAFFGDEDAYDRYTLAKLDITQNERLTPEQRTRQLAALEQELPENLRESLKVINQYQNLESLTQDWQKRGGSAAELRQIRETVVGPEAADRLEALDQERAGWDGRMAAWFAERAAILANRNLSEQDRQRQLNELRNSRFSETERLRVESLERMRDRGEKVAP